MTAATTSNELLHPVGGDGIVSIRMRDGDVRIRAVEGDTLRVRDGSARDLSGVFDIELGEGSASLLDRHGGRDGGAPDPDGQMPAGAAVVIENRSGGIKADGVLGDQRNQNTSGRITPPGVPRRLALHAG